MQIKDYKYLDDSSFLKEFDELNIKEQFVKITVLTWNHEVPIKEIQGRAIGGTINIDGSSNTRRTATISLVLDDSMYNILDINNLISINKKIELEVGFTNLTDKYKEYPILWFPQGIFVIKNPSISHSTSGLTLSLSLSDKMSLLNGDCGGVLPAATTFDSIDIYNTDGSIKTEKLPIYTIIQRLVHELGGEDLNKIIINDIDNKIKQVMRWNGNETLYLLKAGSNQYDFSLTKPEKDIDIVAKYTFGDDIGYTYSDFYYPSELTANAGDTITSVLDKIKNALGNYEYFYDIHGNFIFQEIKNYLNTSKSSLDLSLGLTNEDYLINRSKGKSVYNFTDSNLITSYSNSPQYLNIKNDFTVWGLRGDNNKGAVLRYHLAIDTKPKTGNIYYIIPYEENGIIKAKPANVKKLDEIDDLPNPGSSNIYYIYKDNQNKLWAIKWNDNAEKYFYVHEYTYNENEENSSSSNPHLQYPVAVRTHDWREDLYFQGVFAHDLTNKTDIYYEEMALEWPKIFNIIAKPIVDGENQSYDENTGLPLYEGEYITNNGNDINFYIDFIDSNAKISDFSIYNIGRRSKIVNDTSVNCVFSPEIPDFILIEAGQDNTKDLREECIQKGQNYIQVDYKIYEKTAIGGSSNSAFDYIRSLLYTTTSYNESITLNVIPIYYLEPNTRITVQNKSANINGDYMIKSISLPLTSSGTMTLNCTKALERI